MLVNIPYMEHMGIVNDRKNNNNIVNDREFLLTINHMYIYIYIPYANHGAGIFTYMTGSFKR